MLDTSEKHFDINKVLTDLFMDLKNLSKEKDIELIYEMDTHIPKELRGDAKVLLTLLTNMLTFVFKNSDEKEIVLFLSAPEDFVYEENISFKVEHTNIGKEKILAFLETELGKELIALDGKIIHDNSDVHISIPFTIEELGFRRHYRLPNNSMLNKKVLLVVESKNESLSLTHMFNYFAYTIDNRYESFDNELGTLAQYDLVLIEEKLVTESFTSMVVHIQEMKSLKCVLLDEIHNGTNRQSHAVSTHLIKPVTQESIFELIVSLFEYNDHKTMNEKSSLEKLEQMQNSTPTTMNQSISKALHRGIDKKTKHIVTILNKEMGKRNAEEKGLIYAKELENFLHTFDRSDFHFRKIVNNKAINQIKEFCIDLKKQSKSIGAESMLRFSDAISLIFMYDKLDMLEIYPGKYHIELGKLINEIKTYLHKK